MATLSIKLTGLDDLRETLGVERIKKQVAVGIAEVARSYHSELRFAVVQRYKITSREVDNLLIGNTSNVAQFGKNILRGGISYKEKTKSLGNFLDSIYWGNLPEKEGNPRKGFVHTVEIIRGRKVIVYGKYKQGGFIPRTKDGRHPKGRVFLERISDARYPLRVLTPVNITNLLSYASRTNPKLREIETNFDLIIAKRLDL